MQIPFCVARELVRRGSISSIMIRPQHSIALTRQVGIDCLVAFEARQYSVPFAFVGETVEVRGCHGRVQVLADCRVLASHPRHTEERIVIHPSHFEGAAADRVLPPPPLGRMGRRLQEIAAMEPEKRPMDLYAALAEVAP